MSKPSSTTIAIILGVVLLLVGILSLTGNFNLQDIQQQQAVTQLTLNEPDYTYSITTFQPKDLNSKGFVGTLHYFQVVGASDDTVNPLSLLIQCTQVDKTNPDTFFTKTVAFSMGSDGKVWTPSWSPLGEGIYDCNTMISRDSDPLIPLAQGQPKRIVIVAAEKKGPLLDSSNDIIIFDKSNYKLGDTVTGYAKTKNIGDETFTGKLTISISSKSDGKRYALEEDGISCGAIQFCQGDFAIATQTSWPVGDYNAKTRWIDDDGYIRLQSVYDLSVGDGGDLTDPVVSATPDPYSGTTTVGGKPVSSVGLFATIGGTLSLLVAAIVARGGRII